MTNLFCLIGLHDMRWWKWLADNPDYDEEHEYGMFETRCSRCGKFGVSSRYG